MNHTSLLTNNPRFLPLIVDFGLQRDRSWTTYRRPCVQTNQETKIDVDSSSRCGIDDYLFDDPETELAEVFPIMTAWISKEVLLGRDCTRLL